MNRNVRESIVRNIFDEWARQGKDAGLESGHLPAVLNTFDAWPWDPADRLLDIGCGNGYAVRLATERAPAGESMGIDISGAMIEKARQLSAGNSSVVFQKSGLLDPELKSATFTKIFSMETIYYLEDIAAAFRKIHGLLEPGGHIAILLDFYRENLAVHDWPEKFDVPMTLLSEEQYRTMAQESGFKSVTLDRIRQPEKTGWPAEEGTLRIRATR